MRWEDIGIEMSRRCQIGSFFEIPDECNSSELSRGRNADLVIDEKFRINDI